MDKKQKSFNVKYKTYKSQLQLYHDVYPDAIMLHLPPVEHIQTLSLEDWFWNIGNLTHPNEPWAVDLPTQIGIEAYWTERSCQEELWRLAREVRQLIQSAFVMQEKLESLRILSQKRMYSYFLIILIDWIFNTQIVFQQLGWMDVLMEHVLFSLWIPVECSTRKLGTWARVYLIHYTNHSA